MAMFKVWNNNRSIRKSVVAEDLESLKRLGCAKLSIEAEKLSSIVLESDGTEIDSHEILMHVKNETLVFLQHGESWNKMDNDLPLYRQPGMPCQDAIGDKGVEEIRIILIGTTRSGKSSTGNSILRDKAFHTKPSATSLTFKTEYRVKKIGKQRLRIVDTPGLFDNSTRMNRLTLQKEILKCVTMCSPGPHVFLYVIRIGVLTEQENETTMQILNLFGDDVKKFVIVVFTGLDNLHGDVEFSDYLLTIPPSFKKQFKAFGNRIFPINNGSGSENDKDDFFAKIVDFVRLNKFAHFSNPITGEATIEFNARVQEIKRQKHVSEKEAYEIVLNELQNDGTIVRKLLYGAAGAAVTGFLVTVGPVVVETVAAATGFACSIS